MNSEAKCLTPNSKYLKLWQAPNWIFASRKEQPKIVSNDFSPDAVVIVPILERKLVLISQYRPAIGRIEFDFPSGLIDPGEAPLYAATRELKEETGLEIESIYQKSPVLYSSSGMTDESFVIYFAKVSGKITNKYQEKSENIFVRALGKRDIVNLINKELQTNEVFSSKVWMVINGFFSMINITDFSDDPLF